MGKPIKSFHFPKLDHLVKESLERLSADWPKILNQGVNVTFKDFESASYDNFIIQADDLTTLIEYNITGSFSGKFYLKLPYRDAIIISGTLLMEEENDINANIEAHRINADYKDGFDEFANQTSASFEKVLNAELPESEEDVFVKHATTHHLVIDQNKFKEILFPSLDDELFITKLTCSVWTFSPGNIELIFPIDAAENLFNESVTPPIQGASNILVVDNSLENIAHIKKCLRNTAFNVKVCNEPEETITKLRSMKIRAIVMEVNLNTQHEDGFILCQQIRRNMIIDFIPIIMCSTKPTKELVIRSIKNGASDFLVMPFEKKHLLAKLEKNLESRKKRQK